MGPSAVDEETWILEREGRAFERGRQRESDLDERGRRDFAK